MGGRELKETGLGKPRSVGWLGKLESARGLAQSRTLCGKGN